MRLQQKDFIVDFPLGDPDKCQKRTLPILFNHLVSALLAPAALVEIQNSGNHPGGSRSDAETRRRRDADIQEYLFHKHYFLHSSHSQLSGHDLGTGAINCSFIPTVA